MSLFCFLVIFINVLECFYGEDRLFQGWFSIRDDDL